MVRLTAVSAMRPKALSGLGPIWALWALMGPMGPYGPIFVKKSLILITNRKIISTNIKLVNLENLKVKTWFDDKDLFS